MEGEIDREKWENPEEDEDEDEVWSFDDLECECDGDFQTSVHNDLISTRNSYKLKISSRLLLFLAVYIIFEV